MTDLSSTEEALMFHAMGPIKRGITKFTDGDHIRLMHISRGLYLDGVIDIFDIGKTSSIFRETGGRIDGEIGI